MKLGGKRVLVTGAALRAGRAMAMAFASAGADVVIHFNRSAEEARLLLDSLGGEAAGHSMVKCDLMDAKEVEAMMASSGHLDILINNASTFKQAKLQEESLDDAKAQFDVNFWGPVRLMKLFVERAVAAELAIVNVLDQRIARTDPSGFSYPLSKKVLEQATLAAALQYAPRVRVNAVAPGPVFPPVEMPSSTMERTLATIPLKRSVSPDDLASACLFLAANSSITGEVLYVDCGQSLL